MVATYIAVFLVSLGILAYEIMLMRIFSITQWYHFAYMAVSIALLGFGASGTFLGLFRRSVRQAFDRVFPFFCVAFALSCVCCTLISQGLPLRPLFLATDSRQWGWLAVCHSILFVPFFFGALCVGSAFVRHAEHTSRIYCVNLVGSGAGCIVATLCMHALRPEAIVLCAASVGVVSGLLFLPRISQLCRCAFLALAVGFVVIVFTCPLSLRTSDHKGLSLELTFPQARVETTRVSPLGALHVVSSAAVQGVPDLSLLCPEPIPPQKHLYVDGNLAGALTRMDEVGGDAGFLDYVLPAVPYVLLAKPKVLVLGANTGGDVLLALHHGARAVDAVEPNGQIVDLVRNTYREFCGGIYNRREVRVVVADPRGFVERTASRYDLIHVPTMVSSSEPVTGVHALRERHLLTTEAVQACLSRLEKTGILSLTGGLVLPPRDSIRLFGTAVAALRRSGIADPAKHLVFARALGSATLLISPSPFSASAVAEIRELCDSKCFSLIHFPGITRGEANRYHREPTPNRYDLVQKLLSPEADQFFHDYSFDVRPTSDDRPYFFLFFKPALLREVRRLGSDWPAFVDWGCVALAVTLAQAIVASVVLILVPLFFVRREKGSAPAPELPRAARKLPTLLYFAGLGFGFMFIEIGLMHKFTLFLSHPIYSVTIVLCSILVFSGLGSLLSSRLRPRKSDSIGIVVTGIVLVCFVYLAILPPMFRSLISAPMPVRVGISVLALLPLSLLMGMPFPLGLSRVAASAPHLVPWVWGVNGCASVGGAVLATILAVSVGFSRLLLVALVLYAGAAFVFCESRRRLAAGAEC